MYESGCRGMYRVESGNDEGSKRKKDLDLNTMRTFLNMQMKLI